LDELDRLAHGVVQVGAIREARRALERIRDPRFGAVNGSKSSLDELKASTERRWLTLRRAAKARAAYTAPLIGAPCMLLLVSITSMAPKFPGAELAGTTLAPSTGCPFSSTLKREG